VYRERERETEKERKKMRERKIQEKMQGLHFIRKVRELK